MISFMEYQDAAKETVTYPNPGHNLNYPIVALGGEVGELLNKWKKVLRGDFDTAHPLDKPLPHIKEEMIAELGDILWYIAAVATEMNVSLSDVVFRNLKKLGARSEAGTLKGSGDNR